VAVVSTEATPPSVLEAIVMHGPGLGIALRVESRDTCTRAIDDDGGEGDAAGKLELHPAVVGGYGEARGEVEMNEPTIADGVG